jgi:radical SAM superfamily enzyme YgiQ (UPF0313 family)
MPPMSDTTPGPVIRTKKVLTILLVKPKARLGTVHALHRFQLLEPIELGYIAAAVPREHRVAVLDLRFHRFPTWALLRKIKELAPDIIGFTGYSHEGSIVKDLARHARQAAPRALIVVGGHHAAVAAEDYNVPAIDLIVRGEGCLPFRALVEAVARGESAAGIDGVLQTGERFDASATLTWPRFPDPTELPVPRRDLWDHRRYTCVWPSENARAWQGIFPAVSMVRSSFGCRMKCTFCIVPQLCGGQHRPRSADQVAEEIGALPTDHVYFCDDENFIDAEFAMELAEAIARRGIRKHYSAWARSTTVNRHPELFRTWRQLGLDAAFLGFEFPTDAQLRQVKKGATVAENDKAHTALRSLGVAVHAAFMLMPESTPEDFACLRNYVREMPPLQCSFTVCTPSPGTEDYKAMQPRIWVDNPHDLHDCMHPLTPTRIPLKEFCALYARQIDEAAGKNPLRMQHRPIPPRDMVRVAHATFRYSRAFRNLYRDFPRELWS